MKVKPLFQNILFVLDLGSTSYKEKQKLREQITSNGGTITYILTKTSNYVIVPDVKRSTKVNTYKSRKAETLQIPVLFSDFVNKCVEVGYIVDTDPFCATGLTKIDQFKKGKIQVDGWNKSPKVQLNKKKVTATQIKLLASKRFSTQSFDCPAFAKHFHIGKFAFLQGSKEKKNAVVEVSACVVELHIAASENNIVNLSSVKEHGFRILDQTCIFAKDAENLLQKHSYEYFFTSCKEAVMTMQYLIDEKKTKHGQSVVNRMPSVNLGSFELRHMVEEMGISSGVLPSQVARLVFSITAVALGELLQSLLVDISSITPDQITKAVVLLMKIKDHLKDNKPTHELTLQFNSVLSLKNNRQTISDMRALSKQQDFVQLLKDVMLIFEVQPQIDSLVSAADGMQTVVGLYKMLKCSITYLGSDEEDHQLVRKLLCVPTSNSLPSGMKIRNIYSVRRDVENAQFSYCVTPTKLLLHASDPRNFVGILSRGLLLPLIVISEHGTERTDAGMLGNGIYFSDDIRKALMYSKPCHVSGSRFLLVNEVALGRCHNYTKYTPSLTSPPQGFNSVCGVASSPEAKSDFDLNEYVVFNVEQQRIRYLVEFTLEEDSFVETVDIAPMPITDAKEEVESSPDEQLAEKVTLDDLKKASGEVKSGLVISRRGRDTQLPLQEVHIRAKMMDMVAEVVVMQVYTNITRSALEAKYVFPLDDAVAVCGFEAFINGKHVIGKVKEKEVAHKEYKAAVDAGHGAYLMDQEKPNVFTVSVGNLPVHARVLIKITYVSELPVIPADDKSSDSVLFFIPGSLAAAAKREALVSGPITQTKVDRITASGANLKSTSLIVTVEMPFDIRKLESPTHKIFVKRTAAKACVRLAKNNPIGGSGFKLFVTMAEIHVPRMWVEQHPDNEESQACMLAFYPEFNAEPVLDYKAIILLDMSMSMRESSSENSEKAAKKLALIILKELPPTCSVNVVKFGSGYEELFVFEQSVGDNIMKTKAEEFIQACTASCGSSDAWRPLTSINDLQQSSDDETITNVFLLSDGHLSEENRLLQISRSLGEGVAGCSSRIFTFSVGNSANQHLLRSLAFGSGGAHEHFSNDSKSKWENKVENQLKKAEQPMLRDIKIKWIRYDDDLGSNHNGDPRFPIQAPENIKCLFNASRLVVYGFIPHCTQAELLATVCGKEISTVVSTTQLSITSGKTLHRLTARAMIKDYEEGMHDVDSLVREQLKAERKPHIVELSCRHDVVSPYTSFVAVEEREKDENLSSNDGPAVTELVNAAFVDVIPEIAWDQEALFEELSDLERIKKEIEAAKLSYYHSAIQSNRHFEEVKKITRKLSGVELKEAQVLLTALKTELNMVAEFPVIDSSFGEYLVKVLEKEDTLNIFLSFALGSDVSQWNKCILPSARFRDVAEKLTEQFRKLGIDEDDQRFKDMLKWWNEMRMTREDVEESILKRMADKMSAYAWKGDLRGHTFRNASLARQVVLRSDDGSGVDSAESAITRQKTLMSTRRRRSGLGLGRTILNSASAPPPAPPPPLIKESDYLSKEISTARSTALQQPEGQPSVPFGSAGPGSSSVPTLIPTSQRKSRPHAAAMQATPTSMSLRSEPRALSIDLSNDLEMDFFAQSAGDNLFAMKKASLLQKKPEDLLTMPTSYSMESDDGKQRQRLPERGIAKKKKAVKSVGKFSTNKAACPLPPPPPSRDVEETFCTSFAFDQASLTKVPPPGRAPPPLYEECYDRIEERATARSTDLPQLEDLEVNFFAQSADDNLFAMKKASSSRKKTEYLPRLSTSYSMEQKSPKSDDGKQRQLPERGIAKKKKAVEFVYESSTYNAACPLPPPPPPSRDLERLDMTSFTNASAPAQQLCYDSLQALGNITTRADTLEQSTKSTLVSRSEELRSHSAGVFRKGLPAALCSSKALIPSKVNTMGSTYDGSPPAVASDNAAPPIPPRRPVMKGIRSFRHTSAQSAGAKSKWRNPAGYKQLLMRHSSISRSLEEDAEFPGFDDDGREAYDDEENVYVDTAGDTGVEGDDGDIYSDMCCNESYDDYEEEALYLDVAEEAGPIKAMVELDQLLASSCDESEEESFNENVTKQLQGFAFIFDLLGVDACERFSKAFSNYDPSDKVKRVPFMSSVGATQTGLNCFSQILAAFEEMIKMSGALSLGEQVYQALLSMIAIALAIECCQKYNGISPKHCVAWLKMMDERHPALYSRLELGSSWSDAAVKIIDKLVAVVQDKRMSLPDLKKEVEVGFSIIK